MDKISRSRRSWNMSRIRSVNTKPELFVRRFLSSKGLRYRINYQITGKPDIAFTKFKIAIFIHGCFWHKHKCHYSVMPKTNKKFWADKLSANKLRDKKNEKALKKMGWHILTIWECDLSDFPEGTLKKIFRFIQKYSI